MVRYGCSAEYLYCTFLCDYVNLSLGQFKTERVPCICVLVLDADVHVEKAL